MSRLSIRAGVLVAAGVIASSVALLAGAPITSAAELTGVVTDIRVTPTSVEQGGRLRTDLDFQVPDSAMSGDTFTVTLPAELTQLPGSLVLPDPTGEIVATATISATNPAVATFTLTTYVDDHIDVSGTAFFESQLRSNIAPTPGRTLTFVVSGGATFTTTVQVTPVVTVGTDRTTARKSAVFDDPADQCRTAPASCINWFIESPSGPFDAVHIVDGGLVDAQFVCPITEVALWTVDPLTGARTARVTPPTAVITQTCDPVSGIDVTVTNVPAGVIVRTLISATPVAPQPDGNFTYGNVASVTADLASMTVYSDDSIGGSVRSSQVGGQASGVVAVATTTTVAATTTVPSDVTTTTGNGSGAVVTTTTLPGQVIAPTTTAPVVTTAPVLPATGQSDGRMAVAALLSVLAGGAMLMVSRRRVTADVTTGTD
ncbi:MAG: Ig-like domain-containing protein [Ilumatobacteraceae bacterium]